MSAASPNHHGAVDALDSLCATLERVGDALVSRDADVLLETEPLLNAELSRLSTLPPGADRRAVLAASERVRLALLRCRRLGASLSAVTRTVVQAGQSMDGYDRSGDRLGAAINPALRARV